MLEDGRVKKVDSPFYSQLILSLIKSLRLKTSYRIKILAPLRLTKNQIAPNLKLSDPQTHR
jgi:hypothetical protein